MWKEKRFTFIALSLIALAMGAIIGCEACYKTMTVSGTVLDSGSAPIAGVNVFLWPTSPVTTTGADGKYTLTVSDLGGYSGSSLRFEKTGYTTASAPAFTDAEAGITHCGEYSLVRNVTLGP